MSEIQIRLADKKKRDPIEYPKKQINYIFEDTQEAVKRYIQEQEGKDVFEYSVFGSPSQKIGNFTQQKLSGWSQ